jgi:hypothetical protein
MGGTHQARGGTGKAEAAKLPDAGISPSSAHGSVTVNPIVPVPSLWISLFRGIYFELVSTVDHRLQTMARRKFLVACADKILQRAP